VFSIEFSRLFHSIIETSEETNETREFVRDNNQDHLFSIDVQNIEHIHWSITRVTDYVLHCKNDSIHFIIRESQKTQHRQGNCIVLEEEEEEEECAHQTILRERSTQQQYSMITRFKNLGSNGRHLFEWIIT
jgi:hypothetical protein